MNPRIALPLYSVLAFAVTMAAMGALVAPAVVWPNVLLSGFFLAGIGLGGALLIAVHDASSGRWLGPVRRIACALTRLVLPGSIIVLTAIVLGGTSLFPAWHGHSGESAFKAFWLNRPFFTARAFVYVVIWMFSLHFLRRRRGAAAFLVLFGVTFSLASFDWIMSLDPRWSSTIFGVYHFAGMFTAALAVVAIITAYRAKSDESITADHLHDVGKLLFAMSTFWMYIWFSQAMLIWYGNIPEEASFYALRAYGNWGVLFWAVVLGMWVIPFLLLLPESTKRNRVIITRIAALILIAHWLDLYVSILPVSMPVPQVSGWELAIAFGSFAAVGWAVTRREDVGEPELVVVKAA